MNIIQSIKKNNPDLKSLEIEGILYFIKNDFKITNNDLVKLTGIPKEEIKRFRSSISNLSESDLDSLDLKPYKWSLLTYKDSSLEGKLHTIREKYNLLPKREFDQWFADVKTSVSKVLVMKDKDCVIGKNILLLGDDDLVSSTLGLTEMNYSKITVLDIDRDILDTVEKIARDNNFKDIETDIYDARKEIPSKYASRYDTVVTDPPYTKSGITLFLNRAIEFLGGSNKYIFLYYGNSFKSPEKTIKIQEIINRFNLVIEDKIDKFARYYGAESIGSASSLYILKTTPHTRVLKDPHLVDNIYTFENQSEENFPYVDHIVAKINKIPTSILNSKSNLLSILGKFCDIHKLKVVDTKITKFKGGGLTITYVLSNSNLVVHTWGEFSALHLDLITCSPIYNKDNIVNTLVKLFETKYIELRVLE